MRIIIAQHVGFCPGVKRAYAMAEKALESAASPVYLLGDLVHNHQAVQMLEERGAHRVDTIEEIPSRVTVVTRSHGLEKTTHEVLLEKGCTIVDTTCPRVKKVHLLTSQLEKEGFTIIILGDPKHSEIKSLVSELERSPVILSKDPVTWEHEIGSIPFSQRCVVVEQTTFPRTLMERFCSFLHSSPRSDFCTIRDTLCPETEYRQKELVAHIQEGKIDTIIILGGKHSSNTAGLHLVATEEGKKNYWIESPDELEEDWFHSSDTILVVSGASTPDCSVHELVSRLQIIGGCR